MNNIFNIISKTCNKISKIPKKIEIRKYYNDDITHLKNQKNKILSVSWTEKQISEFDEYWKGNYGKSIPNAGSKLYEAISGKYNCQYIPEFFFRKAVEPYLNPVFESFIYESKNISEFLFGKVEGISFPKTILSCMDGYYRIDNKVVDLETAIECLANVGEVIIKPSVWSGAGRSVALLKIENKVNVLSGESLKNILLRFGRYFIIQEKIANNEEISKIAPNSLNTFRVITYLCDGSIFNCPIALRLGSGNSVVDNLCAGGMVVGVHDDGTLHKYAHTYGQTNYISYDKHPDTNIKFDNYYIGNIQIVKEKAREMHSHITSIGIIAWDIAINSENNPVMIEANILNEGIDFVQFSTGEGLFGENTDKMLKKLPVKSFKFRV